MRMILTSLGISLLVTAIAAAAGVRAVQYELAERPPIAIVDYGPIVAAMGAGESPTTIQSYLIEIRRRAAVYEKAGFVVINAASVDAAPDDVYIPPPDDLPKAWRTMPLAEDNELMSVGSVPAEVAP